MSASVSVVIPTYNCARFVRQALDSVLAQTYRDFDVVVIDDGSTDETGEILKPYFDRIRYIRQENQGISGARNAGIAASAGKYVAFLDSDDMWLPEKLAVQIAILEEHPEYAAVHSDSSYVDLEGRTLQASVNPDRQSRNGTVFDEFFASNMSLALTSSVVIRRTCLDAVGLFDKRYVGGEDWDLLLRLSARYPIWFVRYPLVKYRLTPGSLTRGNVVRNIAHREACLSQFIALNSALFEGKRRMLRRRWTHFYAEAADRLFAYRQYRESHRCFREALRRRPSARTALYFALTTLPPALLERLAGWKRSLSSSQRNS